MLPDSVGALGLDAEVLSMVLGKELGETTLSALGSCCLCNNACLCNSSSKTNAELCFHFSLFFTRAKIFRFLSVIENRY